MCVILTVVEELDNLCALNFVTNFELESQIA